MRIVQHTMSKVKHVSSQNCKRKGPFALDDNDTIFFVVKCEQSHW